MNTNKARAVIASLILACLALLPSLLAAQTERSIASLRAPGIRDFDFLGIRDARLYPETDFVGNPALLLSLPSSFFIIDADLPLSVSKNTLIRGDASIGQKGGSQATTDSSFLPAVELFSLSRMRSSASGFHLDSNLDLQSVEVQSANYAALSEDSVTTDPDGSGSLYLGGIYATRGKGLSWGFDGGLGMEIQPHSFRKTVDSSTGTALTSYGVAINMEDSVETKLKLNTGFGIPLSRSANLGIGLKFSGAIQDRSKAYRVADADSDGIAESLLSAKDFWLAYVPADPAEEVTAYSAKKQNLKIAAVLAPGLRIALSDSMEIFAALEWAAIDLDFGTSYEHFSYLGSPADYVDASVAHLSANGGLASGSALVGMIIGKSRASLLRMALAYERSDTRLSQDGRDAVGNSVYSAYNPWNYTEVALGTAPANGALVNAVGLPWSSVSNAVRLLGAWEYRPSQAMSLFADCALGGSHRLDRYYAYNLDTRSVWSETSSSLGIEWELETTAGLSMDIGNGKRLVFDCRLAPLGGSSAQESESLPHDDDANTDSSNGAYDLTSSQPFSLRIRAGLNVAY